MSEDTVWIPAVPLPFLGLFVDKCQCGKRFWGLHRRERYELHYRRVHERESERPSDWPQVSMPRDEARRLYERVNADHEETTAERKP